MDIQVGDKVTYKDLERNEIYVQIVNYTGMEKDLMKTKYYEILKIERPKYEVIEEKKELLTEEEKEFLKITNKIRIGGVKNICKRNRELFIQGNEGYIISYIVTDKFKGLELDRKYTLKELGLEEN